MSCVDARVRRRQGCADQGCADARVAQTPECADKHLHHIAFVSGLSTEKGNAHASLRGVECSGSPEVGTSNDMWGAGGARVLLCRANSFIRESVTNAQTPVCADEHLHHFAFASGLSTEKGNAHASLRGVECSGSPEVGTSNDIRGAGGARVLLCRANSFIRESVTNAQTPVCADEHLHHFAFASGLSTEKGNAHASLRGVECSGSPKVGTSNDIRGDDSE